MSLENIAVITLSKFFTKYYESLETLMAPDYTEDIEVNDSTYIFLRLLDNKIAYMEKFGQKYSDIQVDINILDIIDFRNDIHCDVYVKAKYHLNWDSPGDLAGEGQRLYISMKKSVSEFIITSITSNSLEYIDRKYYIYQMLKKNKEMTFRDAVDVLVEKSISKIQEFKDTYDNWDSSYKDIFKQTRKIDKALVQEVVAEYNHLRASDYGFYYGDVEQNYIFKRMDNDCTNFVCQCVWAGYGGTAGYHLWNTTALRERVQRDYLMVNRQGTKYDWWGASYDSSNFPPFNFIRVMEFWNFATSRHTYGPQAIGFNDGKYYWEYNGRINRGDVLQFYSYAKGRYSHTVMVVSPTSTDFTSESVYNIRVAQHTIDHNYRPLTDVIYNNGGAGWGEEDVCKMRVMKFTDAVFEQDEL